jgi:hypothetical protein
MALFDGSITDYLDVRRVVVANFGGELSSTDEVNFLMFLGNALGDMWVDVRTHPRYLQEWDIEPGEGGFLLPPTLARICSAVGVTAGVGEEPDVEVTYSLHLAGCPASTVEAEVTYGCGPTDIVTAEIDAYAIVPSDEPDAIRLTGYRRPGPPFFELIEGGEEPDCRSWFEIDLPEQYRNIYAKAVVGMMFYGAGDVPRGSDWLALANAEFAQMQRANPGALGHQTIMYRLSDRYFLGRSCSCDVSENWRFSV